MLRRRLTTLLALAGLMLGGAAPRPAHAAVPLDDVLYTVTLPDASVHTLAVRYEDLGIPVSQIHTHALIAQRMGTQGTLTHTCTLPAGRVCLDELTGGPVVPQWQVEALQEMAHFQPMRLAIAVDGGTFTSYTRNSGGRITVVGSF